MQLRNRLKKLESNTAHLTTGYCTCYVGLKYEVIPITIDEWNRRWHTGEEANERLPDFCDKCRKPVDKRFIEVTFEQHQATVRQRRAQVAETVAKFED